MPTHLRLFLPARLVVAALALSGISAVWLRAQSEPALSFGALRPHPRAVPVATRVSVVFSIAVDTSIIDPRTVQLYRAAGDGRPGESVGQMLDDGRDGDLRAGDRVFTRTTVIESRLLGTRPFRVTALTRDTARALWSPVASVTTFFPNGASREGDGIVFRDRTGEIDLAIPLQDRVETSLTGDVRVTHVDRVAFPQNRSHVLVFGRVSTSAGDVKKWFTQSTAKLIDARGALWEFVAQPGRVLMPSEHSALTDGATRVALISTNERGRDPRVYVYDRSGVLLFVTPEDLFAGMRRVELSSGGQYLLVQGTLATRGQPVIRVFDVETSRAWRAGPTDDGDNVTVSPTTDGRFAVTRSSSVSVLPPRR